jgi:hypothetical protein
MGTPAEAPAPQPVTSTLPSIPKRDSLTPLTKGNPLLTLLDLDQFMYRPFLDTDDDALTKLTKLIEP